MRFFLMSQASPKLYWKNVKINKQKDDPFNRKKTHFKNKILQFLMVQGSLTPNITFLGEKRKNENFEKQKNCFFFSCPKDHSTQKLGS